MLIEIHVKKGAKTYFNLCKYFPVLVKYLIWNILEVILLEKTIKPIQKQKFTTLLIQ